MTSKTQTATNPAHTPGPWRVADLKDKRHHQYAIMADLGGKYGDGGRIAGVDAGFGAHFDWPEAEANARLIAAAPDLLAALKEALDSMIAGQEAFRRRKELLHVRAYERPIREARIAIAKARGSK